MTMEEFLHREEKAKETLVELLQVCFCSAAHASIQTCHHRSFRLRPGRAIYALRNQGFVMPGISDGGGGSYGCVSFLSEGCFRVLYFPSHAALD